MRKMFAPLCRRTFLQYAAGAAGGVTISVAVNKASAASKVSKQAVGYQDHPDGDKRCERCEQFQSPDGCKMVDGQISPQGSCRIFIPIRKS